MHDYCRIWLREIMKEVRKDVPKDKIQMAYAFKNSLGYEFHGPDGYYEYLGSKVDCLYSARAEGWSRYLSTFEGKGKK